MSDVTHIQTRRVYEKTGKSIFIQWARTQTYSHTCTLGAHSVMISMVNKKDLT